VHIIYILQLNMTKITTHKSNNKLHDNPHDYQWSEEQLKFAYKVDADDWGNYNCLCAICERPINVHIDFEEQCNECLAYEDRDSEYDIDYSDKSKLDKYQLKMIEVFDNNT